eukprot:Skav228776  [mRNA]  locus=scaffold589:577287:577667:- [translate_table: standard]
MALKKMRPKLATLGKELIFTTVLCYLVASGPLLGLNFLGFGAAGVAKGSIAAMLQARFPNVAAKSLFSVAQSAGATGVTFKKLGAVAGLSRLGADGLIQALERAGLIDEEFRQLLHRKKQQMRSKL